MILPSKPLNLRKKLLSKLRLPMVLSYKLPLICLMLNKPSCKHSMQVFIAGRMPTPPNN